VETADLKHLKHVIMVVQTVVVRQPAVPIVHPIHVPGFNLNLNLNLNLSRNLQCLNAA
jgi:hypothetical protein